MSRMPVAVNGSIVATVSGLQEGQTYYFAATAYLGTAESIIEESEYSVEVVYTVPGTTPPEPPIADDISSDADNDPPVADSTSFSINENTSSSGQLSANDPEGSSLTYTLVTQAGKGTVTITTSGPFTYTPQHNISGSDSFTFKVSDGSSNSNTAQVNITIQHVNIAPVAQGSSFSVDQGIPYSGQLVATDENGDTLHFAIATAPAKALFFLPTMVPLPIPPTPMLPEQTLFTFLATDGTVTSNMATVKILINQPTDQLAFESGELLVTSAWQHVDFSTEYTSPSVIAKSTTMNDPEAGLVSIRNLTSQGFDIRIREWDNADGVHPEEIVSFMVMERGHHQIADNVYAVAECTSLSGLNTFQPIHFANSFSSQPVVVSSIVTEHESNAATLRMKDSNSPGIFHHHAGTGKQRWSHVEETVCYIAMEKWSGVVDGLMVEAGTTEKILTNKASTVSFKQQFPTIPFVLADMQSANGMDTAIVGMSDLSVTSTGMTILEEQSADSEVSHTAEIGGYFAITPYNPRRRQRQ